MKILFLIIYNLTRLKEEEIFFIISLKYFKKSEIFKIQNHMYNTNKINM